MERVSTYGLGQSLLRSSLATQSRYATAAAQEASGLVTTNYAELGAKASTLISLETVSSRMETWGVNTQTADDRVQSMFSAVGDMIDQMTSLRTTIASATSANGTEMDLNATGETMLTDLAALMNLRMDGRYLFAGSNTQTTPVDLTALAAATTPSTADTDYYTGTGEIASVRVSEEQTISYGVTADSAAFEKALRAANILANMTTSPTDEAALAEASELATEAMDALLAVQSKLSISSKRLESAQASQTSSIALLETMTSNIKDVDVAELSVKLSEYQTQLQASYSALGNIGKLSLVSYL